MRYFVTAVLAYQAVSLLDTMQLLALISSRFSRRKNTHLPTSGSPRPSLMNTFIIFLPFTVPGYVRPCSDAQHHIESASTAFQLQNQYSAYNPKQRFSRSIFANFMHELNLWPSSTIKNEKHKELKNCTYNCRIKIRKMAIAMHCNFNATALSMMLWSMPHRA